MNIPLKDSSDDFFATFLDDTRKYAPYFALSSSRQDDEASVVFVLNQELEMRGQEPFRSVTPRGQGNDPPDFEARDNLGKRIGIEVTELVDGRSIAAEENGSHVSQLSFTPTKAITDISARIRKKDGADIKGGSYDQYILIIYCDDPRFLDSEILNAVRGTQFGSANLIDRAYFLQSYCPLEKCCPLVELRLD